MDDSNSRGLFQILPSTWEIPDKVALEKKMDDLVNEFLFVFCVGLAVAVLVVPFLLALRLIGPVSAAIVWSCTLAVVLTVFIRNIRKHNKLHQLCTFIPETF